MRLVPTVVTLVWPGFGQAAAGRPTRVVPDRGKVVASGPDDPARVRGIWWSRHLSRLGGVE